MLLFVKAAQNLIFGIRDPKPIAGIPDGGRVRVRLRPEELARAFVRTSQSTTEYLLRDCGDHWELAFSTASNIRPA